MKNKLVSIINKLLYFLVFVFFLLSIIKTGLYKNNNFSFVIIYTIAMLVLFIINLLLKKEKLKLNKFDVFILVLPLVYLIPIIFNKSILTNETIKYLLVNISYSIFVILVNKIFSDKKDYLFKIVMFSVLISNIIDIYMLYNGITINNITYFGNGYKDYTLCGIKRLYGFLNYPNLTALFNVCSIFICLKLINKKNSKLYLIIFYILNLVFMLTRSNMIFIMYSVLIISLLLYYLATKKYKDLKKLISYYIPLIPLIIINLSIFEQMYYRDNLLLVFLSTIILYLIFYYSVKLINKNKLFVIVFVICTILILLINIPSSIKINTNKNNKYFIDLTGFKVGNNYNIKVFTHDSNGKINFVIYNKYENNRITNSKDEKEIINDEVSFDINIKPEFYFITLFSKYNQSNINVDYLTITNMENNETKKIYIDYYFKPSYYKKSYSEYSTAKENTSSLTGRLTIYRAAINLVKNKYLTGLGNDAFRSNTLKKARSLNYNALDEHSYMLKLLVETGIFGLFFFIVFIILCTYKIIKKIINKKDLFISMMFIIVLGSATFDISLSHGIAYILFLIVGYNVFFD